MRRHVVRTFLLVRKQRVAVADQPGKKAFQIAPHVRVGILLDEKACRGVANEERQQALPDAALRDI